MGGGQSNKSVFDFKYQKERSELRKALILSFLGNPDNQNIIEKISTMRNLVIQYPEICVTAANEAAKNFDCSVTNMESAYIELERLYSLYETSSILKSAQCRCGQVACPLGHYAAFFERVQVHPSGKNTILCNICDKKTNNGYNCSYCDYNVCVPCSTVYCSYGHAMKLWTHAESQHSCVICHTQPITAGYRCTICDDYDICDLCTYKDGRKAVQLQILERCTDDLSYIDSHQNESATALKTISSHKKKMQNNSYPTTLELFEFSVSLHDVKIIVVAEVRLTRITKEVKRLRDLLSEGKEFSVTARAESAKDGEFTADEVSRLTILLEESLRQRSVDVRAQHNIACPMGHVAIHYNGKPLQYLRRESIISYKGTSSEVPICRICDRVASPEGYHCDFCEYTMCVTCSCIFCREGHPMTMWTIPESIAHCDNCGTEPITSGYYCKECNINTCDLCTTKDARGNLRNSWQLEMAELVKFMRDNKKLSDIALYYHWRYSNYVVSTGLLVDYVKELRMAKYRAEKQIDQKDIIDNIKSLRAEVTKNQELSMESRRESKRTTNYIFSSRKKAQAEAVRLSRILKRRWHAQAPEPRKRCGIACPLGHACIPYVPPGKLLEIENRAASPTTRRPPSPISGKREQRAQLTINPSAVGAQEQILTIVQQRTPKQKLLSAIATPKGAAPVEAPEINTTDNDYEQTLLDEKIESDEVIPTCRICGTDDVSEGKWCPSCEYHLCGECSVIYCRMGHECRIWTLPDATSLSCDMCKTSGITSGYRCMTCNTDCCDLCTTKDARNSFMLWPKREVKRYLQYLEKIRHDSIIAREYLKYQDLDEVNKLNSMSRLCSKMKELGEVKERCDEDINFKRIQHQTKAYGQDA